MVHASHPRKGRGIMKFEKNKNIGEGYSLLQDQRKKDISKLRGFNCWKFGHYVYQCSQNKIKERNHALETNVDDRPSKKKKNINFMIL